MRDREEREFFGETVEVIDLREELDKFLTELYPTKLYHLPTGAIGDKPTFGFRMETPDSLFVIGQISLQSLNEALADVGYKIIKDNGIQKDES